MKMGCKLMHATLSPIGQLGLEATAFTMLNIYGYHFNQNLNCTRKNTMQITLKMFASLTGSWVNFGKIGPVQRCALDVSLKSLEEKSAPPPPPPPCSKWQERGASLQEEFVPCFQAEKWVAHLDYLLFHPYIWLHSSDSQPYTLPSPPLSLPPLSPHPRPPSWKWNKSLIRLFF